MKTVIYLWVAIPLLIYGLVIAAVYLYQEAMIFPASPLPQNHVFQFDVPFKEISVPVDGACLNALHFEQPDPRGLIFFIHGNTGNLVDWTVGIDFYPRVNYDLFIFDYRGYGKSTGSIKSQEQLLADTRKAWDFIAPQYADRPIVIYGRSLGTALAATLARDVHPRLLVLVSPYTSVTAIAKAQYPFLPSWILRYPLRTEAVIGDISSRTLFLHGSKDAFIPPVHSRKLLSLMTAPATLLLVEGADHANIHQFREYLDSLSATLPH